jgi:dinuclear metal center YbgI/SA1388 family protein
VADRDVVVTFCNDLLRASDYQDLSVNGLQVEGSSTVSRLAVAVSTSVRILEQAVDWRADALLVHHGLLYGSRMQPLTGLFARRLRLLFRHDMNLIGYHLPLDGHETIGNCAMLAESVGFSSIDRFAWIGGQPLGVVGEPRTQTSLAEFIERIEKITERTPEVLGNQLRTNSNLTRVGFLTGSGYSALEDAIEAGCQVLVTGDVREPTMAEARELGITVVVAGHEATERFGVQALASRLTDTFGIETRYFHDPNPI